MTHHRSSAIVADDHAAARNRNRSTHAECGCEEGGLLASVLAHVPFAVFWKDRGSRYLGCNHVYAREVGLSSPEKIIGLTDEDLISNPLKALASRMKDREVIEAGEAAIDVEVQHTRPDGTEATFLGSKTPLRSKEGHVIGVLGVYADITERKRAEEAVREREGLERAVKSMEQVLGVIGHELRTPLSGLRAMTEYLLTECECENGQGQRFIQAIHDEVIRLADMVNNLLEAARINSGSARWNWGEVDVQLACRDAVEIIRPLMDDSKVSLEWRVETSGLHMLGDGDAVRRLLLNLLSNAKKHTREGAITVIASEEHNCSGRWIELRVRDTGCGIPREIDGRLGVAFALNAGVIGAKDVTGSGLGLAICRGIAQAHGGFISYTSVPERGTEVCARLRADLPQPVCGEEQPLIMREVAA